LNQKGSRYNVAQGAVVSMRPDGAIRALIGGRDYAQSQFNRATTAKRQPGSSFKPFVYLAAVERGLTPDTVRDDAPISIKGWNPENYSRDYRGPVPLREALALSLNTVAVRLGQEVGPKAVVQAAQRLGISSPLQANGSLALGTSEVTPLEMVGAYAAFANGGTGVNPYVIANVKSTTGKALYQRKDTNLGRVMSAETDSMMNAMMHETFVSGTAKKAEVPGWDLAGKTGTSQDFRDAWFIGYSATLVTGVWLGNDDGESTKKVSGGNLPGEIWKTYMTVALKGQTPTMLPGANHWRNRAPAEVPATTGTAPGGLIGALLGEPQSAAPPPRVAANQRARGPSQDDRNFLEKLFGVGE
jgi:penicillin-binding protein 1A